MNPQMMAMLLRQQNGQSQAPLDNPQTGGMMGTQPDMAQVQAMMQALQGGLLGPMPQQPQPMGLLGFGGPKQIPPPIYLPPMTGGTRG